jgi:hypothetical protein
MLESAAMKHVFSRLARVAFTRAVALVTVTGGVLIAVSAGTACSSTLAQPFQNLRNQPVTIHRLQNYEPQVAQAGAPAIPGLPAIPPQIQQWLSGAGALLPPGLIPPGLLPGTQGQPGAQDAPRFYNFRILGTMQVTDAKMQEEILELFGKESNFQAPRQSCMYAEFGFQIGQPPPPGTPQGAPVANPPADILVSLSCDQVEMKNYGWPYGAKTGMGPDTSQKVIAIVRRAFGG